MAQTVNAPVQIRHLMEQLQAIYKNSRANNTIKKYQQCFNAWRKWATGLNVSFLPGNPLHIGLYIFHKMQAGHSLHTINATFFAIKFYHISLLHTDPCQRSLVKNMFEVASDYQTIKPRKSKHCNQTNWNKYMTISQLINHLLKICDFWISTISPSPVLWGLAKLHQ